jgi:formate dehydrogenase maturation protein FdhE
MPERRSLYDLSVSGASPSSRLQPRDVVELRAIAERQPELAPAAGLQVDLIEAVRRVQARITTPWIETPTETLAARLISGQPLLQFVQIAFDWNDVRLLVRQVTDVLRRHEVIDAATATALHSVGRSPTLPDVMRAWFELQPTLDVEMLDDVLGWAARPYLQRTAEVLQQRVSLDQWAQRICPVCAAEPEFSVITTSGERLLVCGRCHVRWAFSSITCPYCGNEDRASIKSMATPDGVYRVMICSPCGRWVKALDARKAQRPLLPYVDVIATLPLDAAVMKR